MATRIDPKEQEQYKKELISTMLKRANVKEKDIYDAALRYWINDNLDLLTKEEIRKYKDKGLLWV